MNKIKIVTITKLIIVVCLLSVVTIACSNYKKKVDKDIAEMAAQMTGESLNSRLQHKKELPIPEGGAWFQDAGLGVFMHWGPAAVHYGTPWVMRNTWWSKDGKTIPAKTYYEKSMPGFTAKNYNPEKWMQAAKKAGFRYAVITAKHHDGYSLWPSEYSDLGTQNYLNGRDLLQPYVDAVRNNGMKVGFYFSGVDWWLDRDYMNYLFKGEKGLNFEGESIDPKTVEPLPMAIVEQKKKMAFEVMDRYRPDLWWWDTGLPITLEETQAYNSDMIFNNRGGWYREGKFQGDSLGSHYVTPEGYNMVNWEEMKVLKALGRKWEVCMRLNGGLGWFYQGQTKESEQLAHPLEDILYALARIRCWGGNMLLNVEAREDGTLPEVNYDAFDKMARWMEWGAVSMFEVEGTHFPEQSNVPITTSKDGKIWWLHARPGEAERQVNDLKKKESFYRHTQPGKPIRVSDVPALASVKLLRTGDAVEYTYENGVLTIPNPDAGPDGLHEVIMAKLK